MPCRALQVLSESLNWLTQAIEDFGLPLFNVKSLLDWAKEDLGSANAAVRNSAIHMLGVMHRSGRVGGMRAEWCAGGRAGSDRPGTSRARRGGGGGGGA